MEEPTEEELLAEAIRLSQETAAAEAAEAAAEDVPAGIQQDEQPRQTPVGAPSPAPLPSPLALPAAADEAAAAASTGLAPAQQQIVDALIAMSFPPEAARQAVFLSGATELDAALAVLLGEPQASTGATMGPMLGAGAAASPFQPPAAQPPEQQMLGQEEDEVTQEELLRMYGLQASIHKMQADGGEDGFWAAKS